MTLDRLTTLQSHPAVAERLHGAPLGSLTALTIHYARLADLLTPAEVAEFADLPAPWLSRCRSAVSGLTDRDLTTLSPESIALAVAATHGAPERWREVLPLVVRRQDVLARDGVSYGS